MGVSLREFFKDELEAANELRRKEELEKGIVGDEMEFLVITILRNYTKGRTISDIESF